MRNLLAVRAAILSCHNSIALFDEMGKLIASRVPKPEANGELVRMATKQGFKLVNETSEMGKTIRAIAGF